MDNREELIKEILNLAKEITMEEAQMLIKMAEAITSSRANRCSNRLISAVEHLFALYLC